ncbi:unnamed protein product [Lathyrus sativus]|nr:unnamed protein product [Lathyrus sativus]
MDLSSLHSNSPIQQEEDEWDTEGFVIPSLGIEESDQSKENVASIEPSNSAAKVKKEENIYLGPHGAPPSQSKQKEEVNLSNRKQRFKQKLKEADKKKSGTGRENKLDNLRELVGAGKANPSMVKRSSPKDWLDPHCHEAEFERR